jgi:hypothetical protein
MRLEQTDIGENDGWKSHYPLNKEDMLKLSYNHVRAQIFSLVGILFRINRKATKERDDGKKFYQISSAQCSIGPDLLRCR